MNAVGIDVSKGKSMVAAMRPFGEVVVKPFEVCHTASELKKLAGFLKSLDGEVRVVMECTGRYYEPIARYLHETGFFVAAVHAKLIHDFGNNSIRKVKTDKADALKIANYGLTHWTSLKPYTPELTHTSIFQYLSVLRNAAETLAVSGLRRFFVLSCISEFYNILGRIMEPQLASR